MIVRDEAAIVADAIASAAQVCDSFLIVDTGSTDGTQHVAAEAARAHGLFGEVVERPWVDFAHNRTEAVRLAAQQTGGGHVFVLDADDAVVGEPVDLCGDVLGVEKISGSTGFEYPHVFSAAAVNAGRIRYRGVTHEFVDYDETLRVGKVPWRIVCGGNGARRPRKHLEDIALLEAALVRNDEPDLRSRYTFYLAQALRLAGNAESARRRYLEVTALDGWVDERFYAHLMLREPQHLMLAADLCPTRPEPWCLLAEWARTRELRQVGWLYASKAKALTANPPHGLFADLDVWSWKADYEMSIAAYYIGRTDDGKAACRRVLASDAPADVLEATRRNLGFYR